VFGHLLRALATLLSSFGLTSTPAAPAPQLPPPSSNRDDTASLQQRLDAGGVVDLPRLPNGECYRTHGLWVSRDDTTISSDGACIVGLGPGPARLTSNDGDPISADAVFFVARSSNADADPQRISIRGLSLYVPDLVSMFGISVAAHGVDIGGVSVAGSPIDSVIVGGRGAQEDFSSSVSIHDSDFAAGTRNVVSITAVKGLTLERSKLSGASDTNFLQETGRAFGNPAAGIDVEPNAPGDPILDVTIRDNTIEQNAGPGILLALNPSGRETAAADWITIASNQIVANGTKPTPPAQGGIVIAGGQAGRPGHIEIVGNTIRENQGFGLGSTLGGTTTMVVNAHGNRLSGNTRGSFGFAGMGRGSRLG
jgi:Right handed beta helix region